MYDMLARKKNSMVFKISSIFNCLSIILFIIINQIQIDCLSVDYSINKIKWISNIIKKIIRNRILK